MIKLEYFPVDFHYDELHPTAGTAWEAKSFRTPLEASEYAIGRMGGSNFQVRANKAWVKGNTHIPEKLLNLVETDNGGYVPFDVKKNEWVKGPVSPPTLRELLAGGNKWGKYRAQLEAGAKWTMKSSSKKRGPV